MQVAINSENMKCYQDSSINITFFLFRLTGQYWIIYFKIAVYIRTLLSEGGAEASEKS